MSSSDLEFDDEGTSSVASDADITRAMGEAEDAFQNETDSPPGSSATATGDFMDDMGDQKPRITVEAPSSDAVGTEAPSSDAAGTEAPSSDAAGTEAPSSDAAGTEAPSSDAAGATGAAAGAATGAATGAAAGAAAAAAGPSIGERFASAWSTTKEFCMQHKWWFIGAAIALLVVILAAVGHRAYVRWRDERERRRQEQQAQLAQEPPAQQQELPAQQQQVPAQQQELPAQQQQPEPPAQTLSAFQRVLAFLGIRSGGDAKTGEESGDGGDGGDVIPAPNKDVGGHSILKYARDGGIFGGEDSIMGLRPSAEDGEVFNVGNNIYTYSDAKAVCRALKSRLATPREVREAHAKGADWCNYGWSADQNALYPTQRASWKRLQKSKKHRNDCGQPGVNGGHFDNADLRFGANCFGVKPKARVHERGMRAFFPDYISEEEQRLQDKIKEYRNNLGHVKLLPFNRKQWYEDA